MFYHFLVLINYILIFLQSGWRTVSRLPHVADGRVEHDEAALRPLHQAERRQGAVHVQRRKVADKALQLFSLIGACLGYLIEMYN